VAKKFLDVAYVRPVFQKMRRKRMAQAVYACLAGNAGLQKGLFKNFLRGADGDVIADVLPWKKPSSLPVMEGIVFARQGGGVRKRRTAVFPPFALPHYNQFSRKIYVRHPQRYRFAYPQPRRVQKCQQQAVFDVSRRFDDFPHFALVERCGKPVVFLERLTPFSECGICPQVWA
jgi:hypothetical protein